MTRGAMSLLPELERYSKLADANNETARRAALAKWVTDHDNPLTWRSIVNRVWQYHFGRGLVDTPNDFGRNGSLPSHPELLDWLAGTFVTTNDERPTTNVQSRSSLVVRRWSNPFACSQSLKKL